ncbi:GGDEF domain-containing protein [Aquabacterium sp.]|uniref:GGDEF domain-containing protein n=1 Tax=Aquabacterium sp. TaxID=1872578 RepID=UPI001983F60E|nr:GGDEF domain-containing protein [Aquabacterium sp.]MBC7699952.1 GGDEF domain-containing protein [Aquabacterium sp.]
MTTSATVATEDDAKPPPAPPARQEKLADAAALQRQGIKRFWLTLPAIGAAHALLFLSVSLGYAELRPVSWVLAYTLATTTCTFLLLHSKIALRSRDPMLIYPQVLFSVGLVALTYALVPSARSAVLQWLCLIIVFDMRRLPKQQTFTVAALAMLLPALGMLASWHWQAPGSVQLADELVKLALSGVLVPVLLVISAFGRSLRKLQIKTKEDMVAALKQQRQLTMRDGLTGLYNRRHMSGLLDDEAQRLRRSGLVFCLAILDIDFFKRVNDQHGHAMGDVVLQQFAALGLQAFADRTDALARWGGEEFLVLMPETNEAQAHAALSHLRDLVHAHDWSQHQAGLAVRFSAGLSQHVISRSVDQTLDLADQALYRAKAQGRDRIEPPAQAEAAFQASAPIKAQAPQQASAIGRAAATVVHLAEPAPPAAPKPGRSREPKPVRGLAALLLGPNEKMHAGLRQCLVVSGIYFTAVLFVLFFLIPGGFISREHGMWLAISDALPGIIPYLMVRSGITAKWADPGMVLQQIVWACLQVSISYVVAPASRPYDLQVLCVCLVFGFASLGPSRTVAAGAAAIGLLLAAFITLVVTKPAEFVLGQELMHMVGTAIVLWLLTWQSRNFSLARARQKEERQALATTMAQVNQLLTHDALTGMFNRQHMQTLLERECEREQRSGRSFGVALIDLDHFKRINDGHGHQAGDEALVGFARSAQQVLRETDIICRWGGEEFLVLLTDTNTGADGQQTLERLREHIGQQRLCTSAPSWQVTFSAGLALHRADEPLSALLERADQALYAAKANGRNRCVLSEEAAVSAEPPRPVHELTSPAAQSA